MQNHTFSSPRYVSILIKMLSYKYLNKCFGREQIHMLHLAKLLICDTSLVNGITATQIIEIDLVKQYLANNLDS